MINYLVWRLAAAAGAATVVGGGTTSVIPGLAHWPTSSVFVVVLGITLLASVVRKLIHAALTAATLTAALVFSDAAVGGNIHNALNFTGIFTAQAGT